MYGCDSWTVKKVECQIINALELWCWRGLLRVPCSKEIKAVNLKGNQPWILFGRIDAEAPVFWSPDASRWLIGKVPDSGKDWGQKEKRVSEDEMVGWHYRYNEHELGQTLEDGEGQGGLECWSTWSCKKSDMTGWLNNNNSTYHCIFYLLWSVNLFLNKLWTSIFFKVY